MIVFDNVTVRSGSSVLLDRVCAEAPRGGNTIIIGPNGAGKTTLLLALLGEVAHGGNVVLGRGRGPGGRPRFGYVPQRISIDRGLPLTVLEFLCASAQRLPLWLGIRPRARARALELLARVQAEHLAGRRIGALSGGELQRVLLAVALEREPDILVLDELSAGMDLRGDHMFCELLEDLRGRHGFTQLMVSHDLGMVAHHATHVICLKRTVLAQGPPEDVFTDQTMLALFGMHRGIMPWPYCKDEILAEREKSGA